MTLASPVVQLRTYAELDEFIEYHRAWREDARKGKAMSNNTITVPAPTTLQLSNVERHVVINALEAHAQAIEDSIRKLPSERARLTRVKVRSLNVRARLLGRPEAQVDGEARG